MSNDKVSNEVANECLNDGILAGAQFAAQQHLATVEQQAACIASLRAELAAAPAPILSGEVAAPMTTDEAREYLAGFMEQHFTDTTFHRYILGTASGSRELAGDFAWQMATALRRIAAVPAMPAKPCAVFEGYVDGKPRIQWTGAALPVGAELFAAMPAQVQQRDEEMLALHRKLAAETLRADQGWQRYESANKDRNSMRAEKVAQVQQPSEATRLVCLEAAQKLRTYVGIYTGDKQARRLVDELSNIADALATPAQPIADVSAASDEWAAFEAAYDADLFRHDYDKYGPSEAAWTVWQAARTTPASGQAAQSQAVAGLSNAFVTLESNGGEGRNIVLKFNQRADAYAVHDFLLKAGGRDYAATNPPAPPVRALTDAGYGDVLKGGA